MNPLSLVLNPKIWPWLLSALALVIVATSVVGYGNSRYNEGVGAERLRVQAQVVRLQRAVSQAQQALRASQANRQVQIQTRTIERTRIVRESQQEILNAQDFDHMWAVYESAHGRLSDMSDARHRESWNGYLASLGGTGHGRPDSGP